MTRTKAWVVFWALSAALAGCQVATEQTSEAEQDVANAYGGNKTMPVLTLYVPNVTQLVSAFPVDSRIYVISNDPFNAGKYVAALADVGVGKVTVAYSIAAQDLATFMFYGASRGRFVGPNGPPPPNPGGTGWFAQYNLDLATRVLDAPKLGE
ncbi:MAG: hypothetical protein HOO96_02495 [Polyangiaceae bacterium]|nr:hypothetical protein [Polyangiaceae bacterium]